jgi:ectoine hydroxylase-related dioxygenase (phytanoyl-CoA dioxygenase family)
VEVTETSSSHRDPVTPAKSTVDSRARSFTADSSPDDITEHLRRFGYAIVEGLATDDQLDRLQAEAAPYIASSATGRDHYDGRFTRRTGALVARCPTARELIMQPLVVDVVGRFLSRATTFQLHLTQIISIEPGETRQKLHRDQMAFDFFDFPPDYHVQCNTMWALTDFTAENGATHIKPGTSAMSDADAEAVPEIRADMPRGSVLFYDGKVLHGGGANRSHPGAADAVRRGVNITYSVGWVRQEENQFLACPPEIARTLDDDLLRMMGYRQGAFALGYVGDQQDPLAVLRGTDDKVGVVGDFADANPSFRTFVQELSPED